MFREIFREMFRKPSFWIVIICLLVYSFSFFYEFNIVFLAFLRSLFGCSIGWLVVSHQRDILRRRLREQRDTPPEFDEIRIQKPMYRTILLKNNKTAYLAFPYMIYCLDRHRRLYVYFANEYPKSNTQVFTGGFQNISLDGRVCMTTSRLKYNIDKYIDKFWFSRFDDIGGITNFCGTYTDIEAKRVK